MNEGMKERKQIWAEAQGVCMGIGEGDFSVEAGLGCGVMLLAEVTLVNEPLRCRSSPPPPPEELVFLFEHLSHVSIKFSPRACVSQ